MKANPDKCHFLCSSNREVTLKTKTIENQKIKNNKFEKLLDIKLDSKLNFSSHIHDICQKVGQKISTISRIRASMDFAKRHLLLNTFFYSQFNYCPLVWMCHNRTNKISRLHGRYLRLIYSDQKLSFEDLLEKNGSVFIHHRNLRTLGVITCLRFSKT